MAFIVGEKRFYKGTHVMGILNVTGNSFYSLSRVNEKNIVERARQMALDGAEIIDVGAQSTAPNSLPISVLEEMSALIPALETLFAENNLPPVSVDTFNSEVAREALKLGAKMINDVSCLADADISRAVAEADASLCIMHNRRGSKNPDMWLEKQVSLSRAAGLALKCGVDENKIILDGGIGFNLSVKEDKELLEGYDKLSILGYPLLLGASRKSFLGGEPEARLTATLETTKSATKQGILFVRVHDVKENLQIIKAYE